MAVPLPPWLLHRKPVRNYLGMPAMRTPEEGAPAARELTGRDDPLAVIHDAFAVPRNPTLIQVETPTWIGRQPTGGFPAAYSESRHRAASSH